MNYQVGQKVTIQGEDWYASNKQPNGFIVFKDGNKISTFSPGMVKFCGQTFTVAKVVTGSSIYPDHYTFVEDGGAYKWSDQMIAGPADGSTTTYVKPEQPATPAPQPKPVEQPKPKAEAKPKKEPKKAAPKPVEVKKEAPKEEEEHQWNDLGAPAPAAPAPQTPAPAAPQDLEPQKPVEQPKPVEEPKPQAPAPAPEAPRMVEQPAPQAPAPATPVQPAAPVVQATQPESQNENSGEITAFESFKLLLKPKEKAPLADCAVQAFQIISANDMFPEVSFDFNGFEFSITRK